MDYLQLAIALCAALAILIPLLAKLKKVTQELAQEKNWPYLIGMLSKYMEEAEKLFTDGADKKAWVLTMLRTTADQIDYSLSDEDIKNLGDLIDILCNMTKIVNA